MTSRYVAALDQGATSARCMVFDQHGRMVSIAQREHRQYHPSPGRVEHDASEIWSITQRIIVSALRQTGISASESGVAPDYPWRHTFPGPKPRWLFDNHPQLRAQADSGDLLFGTMDTWIVWNLTGDARDSTAAHVTDPTNASRTMLMALDTLS
jgi:glycerol kinase